MNAITYSKILLIFASIMGLISCSKDNEEIIPIKGSEEPIITKVEPNPAQPGDKLTIYGENFSYILDKGLTAGQLTICFPKADGGITTSQATAFTLSTISTSVPTDAVTGEISVKFGNHLTVKGESLSIAGGQASNYVIYQNDFNTGTSYVPFTDAWAWDPCKIRVVDQCLEFYYNAEALAADNRRERRGCEVTCDYHTTTEGWYGFSIYLPSGKFPVYESGIIIAQIFNQGCRNSWAGHLSIDNCSLKLSHRHALVDPKVGIVAGKLETNKWYPIVLYFKAGKNNKGHLRAWIGDDMKESSPAYDSGNCNFGFAHWLDDETLDDTNTNTDCINYSKYGGNDGFGCKFGLYVSNTTDITIRFDDLKALEGNPDGAFNIVKPSNK